MSDDQKKNTQETEALTEVKQEKKLVWEPPKLEEISVKKTQGGGVGEDEVCALWLES